MLSKFSYSNSNSLIERYHQYGAKEAEGDQSEHAEIEYASTMAAGLHKQELPLKLEVELNRTGGLGTLIAGAAASFEGHNQSQRGSP